MSWSAMAFIMIVLRISLTRSLALRIPGMKPQAAPARKPMMQVAGMRTQPGQALKVRGTQAPMRAPDDDLPLAADVDDARAEGDADARADQEEGRRLDEGLGEAESRAYGPVEQGGVGGEGIYFEGEEHDRADAEGRDHASHGHKDVQDDLGPVNPRTIRRLVTSHLLPCAGLIAGSIYHI